MTSCESGRLPEEGTPKLVLKEEQGLVKAEEGSLADEMGSDGLARDAPQKLVGGNGGALASAKFPPRLSRSQHRRPSQNLPGLALAQGLGCQAQKT